MSTPLRIAPLALALLLAHPLASAEEAPPADKKTERHAKPRPSDADLARKVEILTDEVAQLREKLVIPETEALKSVYGLGPAASKVYLQKGGLSIGGYGEVFIDRIVKDKIQGQDYNTGSLLRYVQYVGYKFSDKWVLNAEVEFKHAGLSDPNFENEKGEAEVEFAYLDYLAHKAVNLRLGLMLLPVGFINEIHEPPFFHGALRPAVEDMIIPTTWRALGLGLFGEPLPGFTYKLYLVTGFNASRFSPEGWAEGSQEGAPVLTEDLGFALRLDYRMGDLFLVGASLFYAGADQSFVPGVSSSTFLAEGHLQLRWRGLEFRGLGVYGTLSGARALTLANFPDSTTGEPETRLIASDIYGWYVELAYDFWPLISPSNRYLAPYFRFERLNTQYRVPDLPGRAADPSFDMTIVEAGLTFKPHPQIVFKLSYRDVSTAANAPVADALYFGAGFVY